MTEKIKLLRNISSLFIVQIANILLPMLSVPYVVRIIGPEKFGLINYSGAIIGYFIILVNYAFNLTASRRIAQNKTDNKRTNEIFNEVLGSQIILWIIAFVIFLICMVCIPVFQENNKIFIVTYLITIACVLTPDWIYQGMGDLQRLAFFNLMAKLFLTAFIFFIIRKPSDFFWQPLAFSLVQIFVTYFSLRWAMLKYKLIVKLPSFSVIINVLNNDKNIFFTSILINLYTTTNIVILGSLSSKTEVGYFSAAQKFIILSQSLIVMPLTNSLFPFIGAAFSEGIKNGIDTVKKIAPTIVVIMFTLGIFLLTLGTWFIGEFYGNSFLRSKSIFQVMAFIPFIISVSNLYGIQIMLNLKLDKVILIISGFGAVTSLFISVCLSYYFGALGTATAWLITELIITISMGCYLFKKGIQIFSIRGFYPPVLFAPFNQIISTIKRRF